MQQEKDGDMSDNKLDFNLDFIDSKSSGSKNKFCSKCGEKIGPDDTFCPKCGNKVSHSLSESESNKEDKSKKSKSSDGFYAISNTKLVMLSVLTFGLYEIYWFYKQWQFVKKAKDLKVTPWARGLFSPLFAYPLFKHVFELARDAGEKSSPSAGWLAIAYFILVSMGRFTGWVWIISFGSVLPLFPVQNRINLLWSKKHLNDTISTIFSWKEITIMIIGAVFLLLILFGGSSTSS